MIIFPDKGLPYVEIKVLTQKRAEQKERMQRLVELNVCESVPDAAVELNMEKAKAFISLVVFLAMMSDECKLSLPTIIGGGASEDEEMPGPSGVATLVKTEDDDPLLPVTFTGAHRVCYASVDVFRVNGAQMDSFRLHLKAIAQCHKWLHLS